LSGKDGLIEQSGVSFFNNGYQVLPLHPEMYTAKNYKRREKTEERKATVLNIDQDKIAKRKNSLILYLINKRTSLAFSSRRN
jgi:hypothetical protein